MWPRIFTGTLATACVALTVVLLRDARRPPGLPGVNAVTAADFPGSAKARKTLSARLPEVKLDSVTLEQAIVSVTRAAGTNADVEWNFLEAAGVLRSKRIHLHLWDVTLAQALTALLDEAAGTATHLGFTAAPGFVLVTTSEQLSRHTVVVVYNVRDLIEMAQDDGNTQEEGAEMLVRMIEETIEPDTWRDAGGTWGAIRELSGMLVVTQTSEAHEQVLRLLEQLRAGDRERPHSPDLRRPAPPHVGTPNQLFGK
jgi:hypothetical protein